MGMVATARSVGPMRASAGLSAFRTISPMRAAAGLSATRMASPMRAAAGLTATRMMGAPRGIDLDLGHFDVSHLANIDQASLCLDTFHNIAIGEVFLTSIDDDTTSVFSEEERSLFKAIFNPEFS